MVVSEKAGFVIVTDSPSEELEFVIEIHLELLPSTILLLNVGLSILKIFELCKLNKMQLFPAFIPPALLKLLILILLLAMVVGLSTFTKLK